jgi:hypothetical protein
MIDVRIRLDARGARHVSDEDCPSLMILHIVVESVRA